MQDCLYYYEVNVTGVYDGDSITGDIKLGFGNIMQGQKFRLYGIDTPEVRGSERADGLVSRDWLRDRILGKLVMIKSYRDKSGKYGRWLAEIFAEGENGEMLNLNKELVRLGLAEENYYGTKP